ncbi:MAG: exo-alpha-sialidase [Lachnospiraceae bacterium]|nr:exo-alpha-sialidase [Lachnospiraceae bacterium]
MEKNQLRIEEKEYVWEHPQSYWNQCHCSTLVVNEKGDLLVAYFAGTREGAPDLAIWLSRRIQGVWQEPRKIAEAYGLCHYNPLLHYQDGRVWLFYKRGLDVPRWYTMVCHSDDFGANWTLPQELIPGDHTPRCSSKNKILVAQDGAWMGPCSVERERTWDCYIDISRDYGRTWEKHEIPFRHGEQEGEGIIAWEGIADLWEANPEIVLKWDGVIQPSLWESRPGVFSCLMRSTRGKLYRSDSQDGGNTWCQAYATDLDNNNSGIDLVRLPNGTLVLVYNPVSGNWTFRSPLSISLSRDDGKTWSKPWHLETEPGEFSYPAIIYHEGWIHVTYTDRRKHIVYCKLGIRGEA